MIIAAERFDRIDLDLHHPRMRTSAGGSLNSSLLGLPLKRVEKE